MPLAVLADAAWIAPLWTEAAAEYKAFWPVRVPEKFTVKEIEQAIAVKGHRFHVRAQRDGFYVVRPGYLPEIDALAAELVIWIVRPALAVVDYRATLRDLTTEWLNHEVGLNEHEYGFGSMPAKMPDKSLDWLEDWKGLAGVKRTSYEGPGGVLWYRYYGVSADAVSNLPTAVIQP